jgi:beta-lactamase class A
LHPLTSKKTWGVALGLFAVTFAVATVGIGVARETRRDPGPYVPVSLPAPKQVLAPEPAPTALQSEIGVLAAGYGEAVGVAVIDVDAGWTVQADGESHYPQQSVSKIWTALTLLEGVDRGVFRLDEPVTMRDEDRSVFFQPVAQRYGPDGFATTVEDLLRRALVESDNAAADRLVRHVGGAGAIQDTLRRKGLDGVRAGGEERDLQSRIAGLSWQANFGFADNFKVARAQLSPEVRDAAMDAYLADPPDRATPVAIARALAALKRGELLSGTSTDRMIAMMGDAVTGPQRLKGGLPPGWRIAHKTGTGQDWRGASTGINDVGLVTAPDGTCYAVAVMMRRTPRPVPDRLAFMQAVSRAVVRPGLSPDLRVAAGLPEHGRLRQPR